MNPGPRIGTIDAFRGIAVLIVIIFHYTIACTPPHDFNLCHYDGRFSPVLFLGAFGVQIFFVISGLVIAMTIVRSQSAAEFAAKRLSRLWPAFFVASTITFVAMRCFGPELYQVTFKDYIVNLTMVAPKFGSPFVDGVYWSLGPELKFYAWTAASFLLLRRRFWLGMVLVTLIGTLLRNESSAVADSIFGVHEAPFFLLGMAAYFWLIDRDWTPALVCGATALVALFAMPESNFIVAGLPQFEPQFAGKVFAIGSPIVMLTLLASNIEISWRPLVWIGRISYSLYLIHNRVGVLFISHLKDAGLPDIPAMILAFVAVVAIASTLFIFVEGPGQKLAIALYNRLALEVGNGTRRLRQIRRGRERSGSERPE